eukprot:SAG11_NODE_40320_length_204_cov_133.342857_1_plen_45_part_01
MCTQNIRFALRYNKNGLATAEVTTTTDSMTTKIRVTFDVEVSGEF